MSGGNVTIGQFPTTTTPMDAGDSIAGYQATASATVRFLATQVSPFTATTTATSATAGVAALPSGPVGFLPVTINGVDYKLPYYGV